MTRAIRLNGPRSVDVTTLPAAALRPGELRVRTVASGISTGTELTAYRGTNPNLTSRWDPNRRLFMGVEGPPSYPLTGWGYSEVGEIVEILPTEGAGDGSEADVRVGDVVWGTWGHVSDAVLPIERLRGHELPRGIDPVVGCFVRVGAIALNAVLAAGAGLGETVVVVGQGVIGLLATSFAVQNGARVIVVEGIPARRELALELGAYEAFAPGPDVAPAIRERTAGRGADVAIELSGVFPALHEAIRLVGIDGRVVAAGFYQGEAIGLRLGEEFHHNRVDVLASQIGAVPPHKRARWDVSRLQGTVVDLLADGRPDVTRLVSHRFDVEDAARAYELLDTEPATALQVVFEFAAGAVP
jgi:2-desacetyl-2-hydroxyethyl bacteriochlorophyllide A dehydrogenase